MRLAHPRARIPRLDTGVPPTHRWRPLVADDEPAPVGRDGTGVANVLTEVVTYGSIGYWGDTVMKPMVIVIPSDNNRPWYQQNLGSLCAQEYDHFRAVYIDDGSSDQTGECVATFLADHAVGHRIQLIRNLVRVGALENLYHSIHARDDEEIVILLDGDDWLAHHRVLQTLNTVYADPHCWMTYGQYRVR
jgi:cellulose synthase/poly-beta-1,6-N-acetylglucosamine synthase-like glycosyltransferase